MKKKQRIIYYKDELNDEFSKAKIHPRTIDENFKYSKNPIWDFCSIIMQNVISMPIKYLYAKIKFKHKIIGREKLKPYKKQGYFIYANHTQTFADTFLTSLAVYPKRNFLIVNPENISVKPFGGLVEMLGAIPVPGNKTAMKNFLKIIEKRINKNSSITIYPEAHIWPYYTKIRNFKAVSFKYPVDLKKPVFCITNTYQKYGKNKIQIVSYIDGPFNIYNKIEEKSEVVKTINNVEESSTSTHNQKQSLRNQIYEQMVEKSKKSNIEKIKYVKN